jgi:hypothetical protein
LSVSLAFPIPRAARGCERGGGLRLVTTRRARLGRSFGPASGELLDDERASGELLDDEQDAARVLGHSERVVEVDLPRAA